MRTRRCEWCGGDVEQNYLRMTKCLDGELRRLCEYCALDEEQAKSDAICVEMAVAQDARRRAS
jgi:hypothetical protein